MSLEAVEACHGSSSYTCGTVSRWRTLTTTKTSPAASATSRGRWLRLDNDAIRLDNAASITLSQEALCGGQPPSRLLHGAGCPAHRNRKGHQERLSQVGPQASPRRQPRRQEVRIPLQRDRRGVLGPVRCR